MTLDDGFGDDLPIELPVAERRLLRLAEQGGLDVLDVDPAERLAQLKSRTAREVRPRVTSNGVSTKTVRDPVPVDRPATGIVEIAVSAPPPRYPHEPAGTGRSRRFRVRPEVLAAAAIVAILMVIVTLLNGGAGNGQIEQPAGTATSSPSPYADGPLTAYIPNTAVGQASVIAEILQASAGSRARLNQAIDAVQRCTDTQSAVETLTAVTAERQTQINRAATADLSQLPTSDDIRAKLLTALNLAYTTDQEYLAWAQTIVNTGCKTTADSTEAWNKGTSDSAQTGAAKRAFIVLWNPIAAQFGLAAIQRNLLVTREGPGDVAARRGQYGRNGRPCGCVWVPGAGHPEHPKRRPRPDELPG
jgi:hypothetical protein